MCVRDRNNSTGRTSGKRGLLTWMRDHRGARHCQEDLDMMMVEYPRSAMAESIQHLRLPLDGVGFRGSSRGHRRYQPSSRRREVHGILRSGHRPGPGRPPGGDPGLRLKDRDFTRSSTWAVFPGFQLPTGNASRRPSSAHGSEQTVPRPGRPDSAVPAGPGFQGFRRFLQELGGNRPHHHRHSRILGFADAECVALQADRGLAGGQAPIHQREAGRWRGRSSRVNARIWAWSSISSAAVISGGTICIVGNFDKYVHDYPF